jgi:hypothetical protein
MIKDQAIPKETANAACRSLNKEIDWKQKKGTLKTGKEDILVRLKWTVEAVAVLRAYKNAFKANIWTQNPTTKVQN